MKTVTILIGNSDDKLSQKEWAEFVRTVSMYLTGVADWQFSGISHGDAEWQNACWVVLFHTEDDFNRVKKLISKLRNEFHQDSIAWIEGYTEFLR